MQIGPELELKLHRKANEGVTICLSKDCYRNTKYKLLIMLEHRQTEKMKYTFNALNGIPAYAGVTEHKKMLPKELLKAAKKHNILLKRDDFRLVTKLKRVKVFK